MRLALLAVALIACGAPDMPEAEAAPALPNVSRAALPPAPVADAGRRAPAVAPAATLADCAALMPRGVGLQLFTMSWAVPGSSPVVERTNVQTCFARCPNGSGLGAMNGPVATAADQAALAAAWSTFCP